MSIQDKSNSAQGNVSVLSSLTDPERFTLFVRSHYPFHHKKMKAARSSVRFALVKGALIASLIFGVPVGGVIWGLTHFIVANASSFTDGANPAPLLAGLEPAGRVAIIAVFGLCVIFGALGGYFKQLKLNLQIEEDEIKLKTEFLLREQLTALETSLGNSSQTHSDEHTTIVRTPKKDTLTLDSGVHAPLPDFLSQTGSSHARTSTLNQTRT